MNNLETFEKVESLLIARFNFKLQLLFVDNFIPEAAYSISLKLSEPIDTLYIRLIQKVFKKFQETCAVSQAYRIKDIVTKDLQQMNIIVNIEAN